MTYADDYSIRSADDATLTLIGDAIDDLLSADGPLVCTDYTPTYGVGGTAPTWGTITSHSAWYFQLGEVVVCFVHATGTSGGTTVNYYTFTLPVAPSGVVVGGAKLHTGSSTGAGLDGYRYYSSGDSNVRVYPQDGSDLSKGAARGFNCLAIYKAA
jgi:hypothetical protein